jgi:two-component system response regulator CpxR
MAVITFFSASYCNEKEVINGLAEDLGYKIISREVVDRAFERFHVPREKLVKAMRSPPSMFNQFTHEKERNVAYLRAAMAEQIKNDNIIYHGFAGHLIPKNINHVLRVCLVANHEFREALALRSEGLTRKDARSRIKKDDEDMGRWTRHLFDLGPWDKSLYDIKFPMHSTSVEEAASVIGEYARKEILATTEKTTQALDDFTLASQVNVALIEAGHYDIDVSCKNGTITIIINKNVVRLKHLENELAGIARKVPGVTKIQSKVGPRFHEPSIYRQYQFELPQKVLLVDDEKEFVQTLSERLQMREFGTVVAIDGEEALDMVASEEPEVMVLDLRLPGIDGIDVLRQMKSKYPDVEVIILTGHGTKKDEELARELGAFAYLEKPVDIEKLSQTMKDAYNKIKSKTRHKSDQQAD